VPEDNSVWMIQRLLTDGGLVDDRLQFHALYLVFPLLRLKDVVGSVKLDAV
jgi:hypothetical protein